MSLAGPAVDDANDNSEWRLRFADFGVEGVWADPPRSGRKKTISAEKEAAIVEAVASKSEDIWVASADQIIRADQIIARFAIG